MPGGWGGGERSGEGGGCMRGCVYMGVLNINVA